MKAVSCAVALALILTGLASVKGCVYLYGSRHGNNASHYSYAYTGLDWPEEFPSSSCSGTHQSPIHVPGHTALNRLTDAEASLFGFGQLASNGSNIKVINNGHTVQVKLPSDYRPNATVVYKGDTSSANLVSKFNSTTTGTTGRVKIRPDQFHFHTRSEHVIGGKEYQLEMHIVNYVYNDTLPVCGTGGCITVVGIMFELAENATATPNPFVDAIFSQMPMTENNTTPLPANVTLDFNQVLPADHSYVTYSGSLTTPPCTENILWHVLTTPVPITPAQLHQFELAVGETECNDTTAATGRRLADTTFQEPAWSPDTVDNVTSYCHKIVGQKYREVQDLQSRPIYFYAAQGVCDAQLSQLSGKSKVLSSLLYPSGDNKTMTLAQYDAVAAADMTQSAGCAGMTTTSGADVRVAAGRLVRLLIMGFALVMVLIGI